MDDRSTGRPLAISAGILAAAVFFLLVQVTDAWSLGASIGMTVIFGSLVFVTVKFAIVRRKR